MASSTLDGLLAFLNASPTPYHACENLTALFHRRGFTALDETDSWSLVPGQSYYYTRSKASFVAFRLGQNIQKQGIRLVGAHTDSPCLKVKPYPEIKKHGCHSIGIEVYGGALLNPWFDRDLSLAGCVTGFNAQGQLVSALINFERAIASVPSLAIHLNREANANKTVNAQVEMNAILGLDDGALDFRELLHQRVNEEHPELAIKKVLDFNMSFYDVQAPARIGLKNEFVSSARLDNLLSCYVAAESLANSDTDQTAVVIFNDHEEVGSRSDAGAQGTMLNNLFARMVGDVELRQRMLRHSLMLSVDNAHAIHPNYPNKHDNNHGPKINAGPVIKFDADQSYATTSDTAAIVRWLAQQEENIPLQSYVTRADMRCGSTIGSMTAANSGIRTVDIGVPQFAMHSCRELAGAQDVVLLKRLIDRFIHCAHLPL